jgi:hypothetical protein
MPITIVNINIHIIAWPIYIDIIQNHLCFTSLDISLGLPPPAIGVTRNKQNKRYMNATPHKKDVIKFNNITNRLQSILPPNILKCARTTERIGGESACKSVVIAGRKGINF